MALIVKYKFQNVDANGNSVILLPQFPSGVSYTKTDVVEGNITTRVIETDDLSKVTYIRFGCNEATYVVGAWEYLTEILDINISYVNTFNRMFRGCKLLNKIDVSNWDTSKVTSMSYMFNSCSQLTQLDVSGWNTSKVTSMSYMFNSCSQLTQLDVSNFDTSKVTNMDSMFNSCSQLTQLDVSNFDTSKATNMQNIFSSCKVKNVGLIYCSEDTIDKLANCITSPCNFYVTNKTYTSPNPLVKYVIYREDKKRIVYYNDETQTWEKPILRQWDSIEKHSDGKYYYHKRSGEVVLDGSENWRIRPDVTDDGVHVIFSVFTSFKYNKSSYMICDKFNPKSVANANEAYSKGEGIAYYNYSSGSDYAIYYVISKSKLSSQDVAGFTAWLQANPITVVYQLAEEKVYECTNLDLITYADETNLLVGSGVIVPKTTLKIHQNIANITTILQEKVNVLENDTNTINSNINTINSNINTINTEIDNINTDLANASESIEGSWISVDSKDGYLKDIEILGNTIQNQDNLADIRSVGDKLENQELYEIPVLSTGKNLLSEDYRDGNNTEVSVYRGYKLKLDPSKTYVGSIKLKTSSIPAGSFMVSPLVNPNIVNSALPDKKFVYFFTNGNSQGAITITHVNMQDDGTCYLTTYPDKSNSSVDEYNDYIEQYIDYIQLEEGTQVTPYEPHQEDKLTILSPVQLEKVGDVADRIICKDGVLGVEKNVNSGFIPSSAVWVLQRNNGAINRFVCVTAHMPFTDFIRSTNNVISNKFIASASPSDYIIGCSFGNNDGFIVHANIKDIPTLADFKNFIGDGVFVKYPTTQPQFIPLPYDQQIKLRTFANKTNISFGCEIEGTIKAQVPKSLGATVNTHTEQINNLNKELDRVKKLEESTVSTVTTESDFTTVEAMSNGYFEDVKLEGKTLVNLAKTTTITLSNTSSASRIQDIPCIRKLDKGKIYTLFAKCTAYNLNGVDGVKLGNWGLSGGTVNDASICKGIGVVVYPFTIKENATTTLVRVFIDADNTEGSATLTDFMILEGDHTQNPPEFFEGLKSVGQDVDEISVLSCNENLFDVKSVIEKYPSKLTSFGNGLRVNSGVHDLTYLIPDVNKQYTVSWHGEIVTQEASDAYIGFSFKYTDATSTFVGGVGDKIISSTKGKTIKEFRISYSKTCTMNLTDIQLVEGDTPKPYQPHKQDKKRILYYNDETQTWEKPILREWDSIEKHSDGKYYYHKRTSNETVLNGSENWVLNSSITPTFTTVYTRISGLKAGNSPLVSDKFINLTVVPSYDTEFIKVGGSANLMYININPNKLSTQGVEGFKSWLKSNPITVVYQLAEEKVYECTDLDLITYSGETNLLVKSGVLNPKVTLKVHQNITNIITILQNKVSVLENVFIQGLKQVLAGDMQSLAYMLYPEDFENIEQPIDETSLGEQQDDPTDE